MLHSYSKRSCWRQTRVSRGPKTIFQLRSLPGHRSIGQNMLFGWISQWGIGFGQYVSQMLASILPWFDWLNVTQIFSTFIMICATAIDLYSSKNLILVNKTKKNDVSFELLLLMQLFLIENLKKLVWWKNVYLTKCIYTSMSNFQILPIYNQ